ncbi:MAG: hydantoinase B/oxoprolinase family protein [Pseudohongiellaceae bacterium]
MDAIALSLFVSRMEAICEEMGSVLRRTAFSPNIKDRLDYSCALFDAAGELCAQAAHIPVHLGSMAYAMSDLVNSLRWCEGDVVILNDPYLGGTHLPDVTIIAPVIQAGQLQGFVVNRAHHANIGADSPGSMPLSTSLEQEGIIISPRYLLRQGRLDEDTFAMLKSLLPGEVSGSGGPGRLSGDIAAQVSSVKVGGQRLQELIKLMGTDVFTAFLHQLNEYGARMAETALLEIPDGQYRFNDVMDDDGAGNQAIVIAACVRVNQGVVGVDFAGTSAQVSGNINCPLAVTAAAVYYVFRCLMPDHTPACAGIFRSITIQAPAGSLVNARRPAAVAAGNVETSTRIVDVVLGALQQALPDRIPAASQGTMNNIAMGVASTGRRWDYYETLAGGMGGGPGFDGASARHSHMTNTLNTPVESIEMHYPVRIIHYALRRGSGGSGRHKGGDGLIREYEFLEPASVSLLTERRSNAPWGIAGGGHGMRGINRLNGTRLAGKVQLNVVTGDRLVIETPGGGGWGSVQP